jgi:hypothetical protein
MQDISEDDFKNVPILRSCCGWSTDKRLFMLVIQFVISLLLLMFSAMMLVTIPVCDSSNYQNLIFSILSFWFGRKIDK